MARASGFRASRLFRARATPLSNQKVRLSSESSCNTILYGLERVAKNSDPLEGPPDPCETFCDPVRIGIQSMTDQQFIADRDYLCCQRSLHTVKPLKILD